MTAGTMHSARDTQESVDVEAVTGVQPTSPLGVET